jgi:hypothetical protein
MAFSIDFAAAYTVLAILLVCTFFTATNVMSAGLTAGYAGELGPLAGRIGDVLLKEPGEPYDWYMAPRGTGSPVVIGLSDGDPNILSIYKVDGLYMFNASALKTAVGLYDEEGQYGLRIEIDSMDGAISRAAGYPLPPDTKDVCKSCRLAAIRDQDGIYREAEVSVYLWRKDVGAR